MHVWSSLIMAAWVHSPRVLPKQLPISQQILLGQSGTFYQNVLSIVARAPKVQSCLRRIGFALILGPSHLILAISSTLACPGLTCPLDLPGLLWPSWPLSTLTLQELGLRAAAGGLEDADTLTADDDAINDPEALDDCSMAVSLPTVGTAKKSKTDVLAKKSTDYKRMWEILGGSSSAQVPNGHLVVPCPLWWKELQDNTQTSEGLVLLREVDTETWYNQTFLTQGGVPEIPHATEFVRVSRIAASSAQGSGSAQTMAAEDCNAQCQRGAPAMKAIIEKLVKQLPITYGGLLITVPFGGVRDVSLAALSVRAETGYDIRVLEYEAREFFHIIGEERILERACADFNAGRLLFKGAEPLAAFDAAGSSAPVLREAVAECRTKLKVLGATDDGLLIVPELTTLPEEMKSEEVKNKLASLRSFSKKFPSLVVSTPGKLPQAADWKVVANTELTDVVGRVHVRGVVITMVGAEAAATKYGAQMGFQNETEDDITMELGDLAGCGDLEVKQDPDTAKVSMPFAFENRVCAGPSAIYASPRGGEGGFVKSTVASALETVKSSPPELLVYGHNATVNSGKVTLTRAEDIFACSGIPDEVDVNNVGAYAILDAENGKKTFKCFSFLPVFHFNPMSEPTVPTYHLQPLNNSQLLRLFVKKAFTVPAGKTMFPKWA